MSFKASIINTWRLLILRITKNWLIFLITSILFVAILAPYIFTRNALNDSLGFGEGTGPVGDTIGGLTAPFMSLIGSILVYVAFKEQIKANNLIKEQLYFQQIQSQIIRLEDKSSNIFKILNDIEISLNGSSQKAKSPECFNEKGDRIRYKVEILAINQLAYIIAEFSQMLPLIMKSEDNRKFLEQRILNLYTIFYQKPIDDIVDKLRFVKELECIHKKQVLSLIEETDKVLESINIIQSR